MTGRVLPGGKFTWNGIFKGKFSSFFFQKIDFFFFLNQMLRIFRSAAYLSYFEYPVMMVLLERVYETYNFKRVYLEILFVYPNVKHSS